MEALVFNVAAELIVKLEPQVMAFDKVTVPPIVRLLKAFNTEGKVMVPVGFNVPAPAVKVIPEAGQDPLKVRVPPFVMFIEALPEPNNTLVTFNIFVPPAGQDNEELLFMVSVP